MPPRRSFDLYRITNQKTGKSYIGQTVMGINHRWSQHISAARKKLPYALYRSMNKHGIEAFSIEKIGECDNSEDLSELERFAIAWFDTLVPRGYNMTEGGESGSAMGAIRKRWDTLSENKKGDANDLSGNMGATLPNLGGFCASCPRCTLCTKVCRVIAGYLAQAEVEATETPISQLDGFDLTDALWYLQYRKGVS